MINHFSIRDFATIENTDVDLALTNEDLRSFLKKESLKIFDHEYDILYALVKDKEIASGVRFFAVYYGGYLFTYIGDFAFGKKGSCY